MYLAGIINEVLESKKDKLLGKSNYFYICNVLNRSFRNIEPFKFMYEIYPDYSKEDYSVSGVYDMVEDVKYVVLNFSKDYRTFELKADRWKDFKFAVSQVCQHEAIHQCQWSNISDLDHRSRDNEKLDFRNVEGTIEEDQDYLSDPDEIDAYSHDIAMEIAYFYPKKDPYVVLSLIHKHKKLWSYNYYKKTFKNKNWSDIKHRLLKKTYKWIPYVTV